jgi:hypothetical protein
MFNNCRQYNEEGSVIYEDANKLERLLMEQAQTSPNTERRFTPRAPGYVLNLMYTPRDASYLDLRHFILKGVYIGIICMDFNILNITLLQAKSKETSKCFIQ